MAKKSIKKGIKRKIKKSVHPNSLANLKSHPGRPKGVKNHDGLTAVLNMLKGLISEDKNLKQLKNEMQVAFNKHPLGFYYKFVMPLFPKNVDIPLDVDTVNFIFNNVKRLPKGDKKK
ncbi:hypothetical protein ES707_20134 [subsurface metagenome]